MTSILLDEKGYDNRYTMYQAGLLQIYQGFLEMPFSTIGKLVDELAEIEDLYPFDAKGCNFFLKEMALELPENRENYQSAEPYESRETKRSWIQKKTKALLGYLDELDKTIEGIFDKEEMPKRQEEAERQYEELEFWKKHPL